MHVLLNEKDIDITLDICSGTFYLDRKLLTQVLYNLIDNAIKYTQANGSININSIIENDHLKFLFQIMGLEIANSDKNMILKNLGK